MRFAVPLSDPDELPLLKDAGANEIYLGLLEEKWTAVYGDHDSISRRQGRANLTSASQLRQVLEMAGALDMPVDLTLNGRYTAPQYGCLEELAGRFAKWGGRGVILRDVGLMRRFCQSGLIGKGKTLRCSASLLTVTVNADGVRFFRELGADRVVLPRFLAVGEMKMIAAQEPGMEYEAMVFGDKCPMIDGLCRSFHGQPYERADLPDTVSQSFGTADDLCSPDTSHSSDIFCTFDTSCEAHHLCEGLPRESDPCAACRMKELEEAGITVMKFGGRGTPLEYRLKALRFFDRVRQQLQNQCGTAFLREEDQFSGDHRDGDHCKIDLFRRDPKEQETGNAAIIRLYRETFGHDCSCYYK